MKPIVVALTGATSFTGIWIAQAFAAQGARVFALCQQDIESYVGLKKQRIDFLKTMPNVNLCGGFNMCEPRIRDWIASVKPQIWIHHHHYMEQFRSLGYDMQKAEDVAIKPLTTLIPALENSHVEGIIFSGSYFQNDQTPTPYARSKQRTWELLQRLAHDRGIRCTQVLIPDPVGPYENADRLIPVFLRYQQVLKPELEHFELRDADDVADHVDAKSLGFFYHRVACDLIAAKQRLTYRPSGWIGTHRDWLAKVANELVAQTLHQDVRPWAEAKTTIPARPAIVRRNNDHSQNSDELLDIHWSEVWKNYAQVLRLDSSHS